MYLCFKHGKTSDNKKLAEKVFNISDTWVWSHIVQIANTNPSQKKKLIFFFILSCPSLSIYFLRPKAEIWSKVAKALQLWSRKHAESFRIWTISTLWSFLLFFRKDWKFNILSKQINAKKHSFWVLILYWIFASLDLPEFLIPYLCLASHITWWHNWK